MPPNSDDRTAVVSPRPQAARNPQTASRQAQSVLRWGAHTDRGPRPDNQDSFSLPPNNERDIHRLGALLVVCDGVGGASGGREAARMAATLTQQSFYSANDPTNPRERLKHAIDFANRAIQEQAERSRQPQMATTIVAACVLGNHLYIAYAGDSRAYLFREDRLTALTVDHSAVVEDAFRGLVAMSATAQANYRNIVTRSLGAGTNSQLDYRLEVLQPGDRVLLCTDGLHTALSDRQIEQVLRQPVSAQRAAELLVEQASRSPHAKDNITAAVLDFGLPAAVPFGVLRPPAWLGRAGGLTALIAVAILAWGVLSSVQIDGRAPQRQLPRAGATQPVSGIPLLGGGDRQGEAPTAPNQLDGAARGATPRSTATLAPVAGSPTPGANAATQPKAATSTPAGQQPPALAPAGSTPAVPATPAAPGTPQPTGVPQPPGGPSTSPTPPMTPPPP
ncbi:MAG: protein phosphatase 2C domain-containing protein, partial [Anaerolineae bacterium]|nr:protein phosphatase 2C domain-containing protein [Anaerolineae bacterium]